MPRVNTEDLIDAAEVARILGLKYRNSVSQYLHLHADMPRPVINLANGRTRLWIRQEIEAWARERSRGTLGGRSPKD